MRRLLARDPAEKVSHSRAPGEATKIGHAGEREEVGRVRRELAKQGYDKVYDKKQMARTAAHIADDKGKPKPFDRSFADGRARPDLIAINTKDKKVLVLDLTKDSDTTVKLEPGDRRRLPNDAPSGEDVKLHLEKTIDDAKQVVRRPPGGENIDGFRVVAQDRYWATGKYSREVTVGKVIEPSPGVLAAEAAERASKKAAKKAEKAKTAAEHRAKKESKNGPRTRRDSAKGRAAERPKTYASSQWDATSGPSSHPARKGPSHKPQPHDPDRAHKPLTLPSEQPPPAAKPITVQSTTGGKVVKQAGETAVETVSSGKLYTRLARFGVDVLDGLVPSPLDVLDLLENFAKSYQAALNDIRRRNLTTGFAIGWAAYLVIPRWDWAKEFAHNSVSRDVAAQILDAVGIAENAFNQGLVRGFMYGEKHSAAQADEARQKAFEVLLKAGRTPGRHDGDDVYTFGRDDVYSFAAALMPAARKVLAEADVRRAARRAREKLEQEAKRLRENFDRGIAPAGARWE